MHLHTNLLEMQKGGCICTVLQQLLKTVTVMQTVQRKHALAW